MFYFQSSDREFIPFCQQDRTLVLLRNQNAVIQRVILRTNFQDKKQHDSTPKIMGVIDVLRKR